MGIVNACEKSEKDVCNEIYLNKINSQANLPKMVQKQNQFSNKVNNSKQQQENISPIQELQTQESSMLKSTQQQQQQKGLTESNSLKILKIEQNEIRLLNSMYSNNIMNPNGTQDMTKSRANNYSQYAPDSRNDVKRRQSSHSNKRAIDQELPFAPSRHLTTSSLTRTTYQQPVQSGYERKRVKEIYEDNSVYEGQVMNGLRDGQGTFTYSNSGAKYVGQWNQGNIEGFGVLYFSNNKAAYEGNWKDNKFNGNGVVYNENQDPINKDSYQFDFKSFEFLGDYWYKYDGNFVDDQKHGLGTLYLKNGEKFVGNFNKDFVDGNGAYYKYDGTIILGQWQNNVLINETSRMSC